MKKNKTVAFMLAATLMVGGTFLGTKAWFTDTETSSNNLVVTTGTLDLTVTDNEGWVRKSTDSTGQANHTESLESAKDETNTSFTNVRPGDYFEKEITVTNTGTLKQKLTITNNITTGSDLYDVSVTGLSTGDEIGVADNDKTKTLKIVVTPKANDLVSDTHEGKKIIDINGNLVIQGDQINK